MTEKTVTLLSIRKNAKAECAAIGERIVALLKERGPLDTPQLRDALGMFDEAQRLGNVVASLLRRGLISRVEVSKNRYRYYHGQTSGVAYKPSQAAWKRVRPVTEHSIPVKRVVVAPSIYPAVAITLPAAPWEVRA